MATTPTENNAVKMKFGSQLPSVPDPDCIYFIIDETNNTCNLYLGSNPVHAEVSAITDDEINEICK